MFSFRRLVNLKGNPSFLLAGITTSAEGPYTVVLKSKTPNPAIPVLVANPALGIVNSKVVKAHGGTDAVGADKKDKAETYLNAHSAGSGPYILKSFSTTSQVMLTRTRTYWGAKPKFPTVVIRNMLAADAAPERAARHERDRARPLARAGDDAQGQEQGAGAETPSPNMFFLFANHDTAVSPTTSNQHFQKAIRFGLDYNGARVARRLRRGAGRGIDPVDVPRRAAGARAGSSRTSPRRRPSWRHRASAARRSSSTTRATSSTAFVRRARAEDRVRPRQDRHHGKLTGSPVATSLPNYRAGKDELGLWYWGPDYPDPNDYLVFLPGATVGLRAGWPAGADPTIEALGKKAAATSVPTSAEPLPADPAEAERSGPFFPLFQPAQVIVASKNLTSVVFNVLYWIDVAAIGSR